MSRPVLDVTTDFGKPLPAKTQPCQSCDLPYVTPYGICSICGYRQRTPDDDDPHDENKLPRWAQERLAALEAANERLAGELVHQRRAAAVLTGRRWLTLPGPVVPDNVGRDYVRLWYLNADQPLEACTLYRGDVLLIGRADPDRKEKEGIV